MTSSTIEVELSIACLKARAALLASLEDGAFQNVLMISQLLPVLNHKSYVDLISPDCLEPRGSQTLHRNRTVFNLQSAYLSLHVSVRGSG